MVGNILPVSRERVLLVVVSLIVGTGEPNEGRIQLDIQQMYSTNNIYYFFTHSTLLQRTKW